jgi:hypothetical protein
MLRIRDRTRWLILVVAAGCGQRGADDPSDAGPDALRDADSVDGADVGPPRLPAVRYERDLRVNDRERVIDGCRGIGGSPQACTWSLMFESVCSTLAGSPDHDCVFGSLPGDGHSQCFWVDAGIRQCKGWFERLL